MHRYGKPELIPVITLSQNYRQGDNANVWIYILHVKYYSTNFFTEVK
jgi:hypothetical protein